MVFLLTPATALRPSIFIEDSECGGGYYIVFCFKVFVFLFMGMFSAPLQVEPVADGGSLPAPHRNTAGIASTYASRSFAGIGC